MRPPATGSARRRAAAALTALVVCAGCGDRDPAVDVGALATECGLRHPQPDLEEVRLPRAFLPPRSELVDVHLPRIGGMSAIVNLAYSVEETFELYRTAAERAGFEVTSVDFEGFEGEIWLRNKKELGSIVVRGSACEHASGVIISIVAKKDVAG